jgi:hypothetical protein
MRNRIRPATTQWTTGAGGWAADVFKSFHDRAFLRQGKINKKSISIDIIEIKQSAIVAQVKINGISV